MAAGLQLYVHSPRSNGGAKPVRGAVLRCTTGVEWCLCQSQPMAPLTSPMSRLLGTHWGALGVLHCRKAHCCLLGQHTKLRPRMSLISLPTCWHTIRIALMSQALRLLAPLGCFPPSPCTLGSLLVLCMCSRVSCSLHVGEAMAAPAPSSP